MKKLTPEQSEKLQTWIRENDHRLWVEGLRYPSATIEANDALHLNVNVGQFKRCQRRLFEEIKVPQKYFGWGGSLKREPQSLTNRMWERLCGTLGRCVEPGKSLLGLTREMKEANVASVEFSADAIRQTVHNHRGRYGVDWDDLTAEDPTLVTWNGTPETAKRKD